MQSSTGRRPGMKIGFVDAARWQCASDQNRRKNSSRLMAAVLRPRPRYCANYYTAPVEVGRGEYKLQDAFLPNTRTLA